VRLAAGAIALAFGTGTVQAQATYLDAAGLARELQALAGASDLATVRSLGRSAGGRDIWLVEIAARGGAPLDTRPGLLVVGNLEGDHLVGSSHAVEIVRYLLSADGRAAAGDLLQRTVIYVLPRLNPDGAERRTRRNSLAYDDDNDGRTDEDPGEDLNGDGEVTVMRVADPTGEYLPVPGTPRLMKRADRSKGETGTHKIHREGRDTDGDGFLNEDGAGGVDLNRNFQHEYPYYQRDAGPYMVSEPESRALLDFVIAHRNIAAVLTFGLSDNLVTPPNDRGALAEPSVLDLVAFADSAALEPLGVGIFQAQQGGGGGFFFGGGGGGLQLRGAQPGRDNNPESGRRPVTTVHRADLTYFTRVSELYKELTGITRVGVNRRAQGAFFQYGYYHFGVPSFSTPGWGLPQAAADTGAARPRAGGGGGPGGPGGAGAARGGEAPFDERLLAALEGAGIEAFVDWQPFDHPDLGPVEIGGFRSFATVNPPEAQLAELGRKHGEFVARLAGMLPHVRVAETEVTSHGGGVFTVSVTVENTGYFPASLQHGVVAGAVDPTIVQLQVPPETLLTGHDLTHRIARLEGSGARETVTWVIRGRQGESVTIRVRAQKGGTSTFTVTLR